MSQFDSGKGHADENFPVGSFLIAPRHRPVVFAFYHVARMADDVADHATAEPEAKLARLAEIEDSLTGKGDRVAEAVILRRVLAERGVTLQHALELLEAFRRDVTKSRYADWEELMDYCRYSAAPVGRFMLDVHGESRALWPASDAQCAALQIINHLQDCGKDYRDIDRVYVPLDALAAEGLGVEALGAAQASPGLLKVLHGLAARTDALLAEAAPFAGQVRDLRLALEIGVIHALAAGLCARLRLRDPLSQRVHHSRLEMAGGALGGLVSTIGARLGARRPAQAGA
ncbi:MAG: squalene synthase HpnC [Caulobacterales bacterium]